MIPRYRGKLTGGRPSEQRRRHKLAIAIEAFRVLGSIGLLYLAFICALGLGLGLATRFGSDLAETVTGIPVIRQFAIQADNLNRYGAGVLPVGLAAALALVIAIHFVANLLVDDLVDR